MNLRDLSPDELREMRTDLDHQLAELRARKLEVARALEGHFTEPEPESRVVSSPEPQTVAPAFVETESDVPSLDEPELPRKRRWGRR